MAYKSRKRNYKSRRERIHEHWRNIRIMFIFGIIILAVLLFKNRISIWTYFQTFFY